MAFLLPGNEGASDVGLDHYRIPKLPAAPTVPPSPPAGNDSTVEPVPAGYLLYETFDSQRDGIWTVPSYRPTSSFIDTTFLPSNVRVEDGLLVLRSDVDRHTGGEYKTKNLFKYGKYRASMKLDQTPGTYLTFFTYMPNPRNHSEVDIELVKLENGTTEAIMTTWVQRVRNEESIILPFDPSDGYHTYGFDWYPDRVDFFIDDLDVPVWTSTRNVPQGACYLYLNSWVVKKVPASHGDGINTQQVDWVTVQPLDGTD
jgi:hypothetical protein